MGGIMFPHNMLPNIAGKFSKLLPATHAMNAFTSLAMGKVADFSSWGSVVVLLFGSLVSFALAVHLFSWDPYNIMRRRYPFLGFLSLLPYIASVFFYITI
jgi:ABC-2 type transport system permease protein